MFLTTLREVLIAVLKMMTLNDQNNWTNQRRHLLNNLNFKTYCLLTSKMLIKMFRVTFDSNVV